MHLMVGRFASLTMSEIDKLPPTPPDEEVGKLMRIFVKTTEGLRRCRSEIEIDRGTKRSKGADNGSIKSDRNISIPKIWSKVKKVVVIV